uniref:Uncharacterized protein n=1 Tax=Zea mays TaxID=4577 RepID=C4J060_MAIZE|nr:unknown [Zea mays]
MCIACENPNIILDCFSQGNTRKHYRTFVTAKIHTFQKDTCIYSRVQNNIHVQHITSLSALDSFIFFSRAAQSYSIYCSLPSGQLTNMHSMPIPDVQATVSNFDTSH